MRRIFLLLIVVLGLACLCSTNSAIIIKSPSSSSGDITTGLVAWWDMEEASGNALDQHNSFDATDNNTVAAQSPGKVGDARSFAYLNTEYFSRSDEDDFTNDEFTVCGWFQTKASNSEQTFFAKSNESGNEEFLVGKNGNKIRVLVSSDGTANTQAISTSTISLNTWYFFACRADGVNVGIRLGADAWDETAFSGSIFNSNQGITVGCKIVSGSPGGLFHGYLDEIAYWNRALTDDEVDDVYNAGTGLTYSDL